MSPSRKPESDDGVNASDLDNLLAAHQTAISGKPLTAAERKAIESAKAKLSGQETADEMTRQRNPGGGRKKNVTLPTGGGRRAKPPKTQGGLGLAEAIKRLQLAEREAFSRYQTACDADPSNPGAITWAKKNWVDLAEQLRKIESTAPDVDAATAKTLPIAEVERETARMVMAFRQALENSTTTSAAKLVAQGLVPHDRQIEAQEILRLANNNVLAHLHTESWGNG